jgi:hypothetical protein
VPPPAAIRRITGTQGDCGRQILHRWSPLAVTRAAISGRDDALLLGRIPVAGHATRAASAATVVELAAPGAPDDAARRSRSRRGCYGRGYKQNPSMARRWVVSWPAEWLR